LHWWLEPYKADTSFVTCFFAHLSWTVCIPLKRRISGIQHLYSTPEECFFGVCFHRKIISCQRPFKFKYAYTRTVTFWCMYPVDCYIHTVRCMHSYNYCTSKKLLWRPQKSSFLRSLSSDFNEFFLCCLITCLSIIISKLSFLDLPGAVRH